MNTIDLHTHTTASDGLLTPTALVREAAALCITTLAVTDHDTTNGLAEARAAAGTAGIELIPGVELNTDVPGGEVHVLGYFVDFERADFQAELSRLRAGRLNRAQTMVEKLQGLGVDVTWERVQAIAGDAAVGRPHVAQALVDAGAVAAIGEAFDRYIGREGPYVERLKLSPAEATAIIAAAGGVPVMAHPLPKGASEGLSPLLDLDAMLPEMIEAGLKGLEAYYTGYTMRDTEFVMQVARRYGLIVTGGSDFHGPGRLHGARLGGVYIPRKALRALKQAHQPA
jgi:predicted metal-dependent phosphoesterase TrpH